jgi:hypothetical protein
MIVLPIVSAQTSVRLSVRLKHPCGADIRGPDYCGADRGAPAPPYPSNPPPRRLQRHCRLPGGHARSIKLTLRQRPFISDHA